MKTMSLTAARMKRAGKLTAALGDEQVSFFLQLISFCNAKKGEQYCKR